MYEASAQSRYNIHTFGLCMFFYISLVIILRFYSRFCETPCVDSGVLEGLLNLLMKNKMENVGAGQWRAVLAFCRGQRSSGVDNLECVHSSVKALFTDHRSLFSKNRLQKHETGLRRYDQQHGSDQALRTAFIAFHLQLTAVSDTTGAQKCCLYKKIHGCILFILILRSWLQLSNLVFKT